MLSYRFTLLHIIVGVFFVTGVSAQTLKQFDEAIPAGSVRVFSPDTLYVINSRVMIGGKLLIKPGTTIEFHQSGRFVDSTGGKIIANACGGAPIVFRGKAVNATDNEWGHITILPGADSAYFANCKFLNLRKDTLVDRVTLFLYYNDRGANNDALNAAITALTNGSGGAITTFSQKTFLYRCSFDSCQARFRGGAIQFLQAPQGVAGFSSSETADDARLALAPGVNQIARLVFTRNRVVNPYSAAPSSTGRWNQNQAFGGAVYMHGSTPRSISLGGRTGTFACETLGTDEDVFTFISNSALLLQHRFPDNVAQGAFGGALYVGPSTSLEIAGPTIWSGNVAWADSTATSPSRFDALASGGAMYAAGTLRFSGSSLAVENNSATSGGAVFAETLSLLPQGKGNFLFKKNSAVASGGALAVTESTIRGAGLERNLSDAMRIHFTGNVSGKRGGAIYASGKLLIARALFDSNSVNKIFFGAADFDSSTGGGAIYTTIFDTLRAVEFRANRALGANGGALYIDNPPASDRLIVEDSYATGSYPDPVHPHELTVFYANQAVRDSLNSLRDSTNSGLGGAIFIRPVFSAGRTDETILSRVRIEANVAWSGSAIYSDGLAPSVAMTRSLVTNNTSLSPVGYIATGPGRFEHSSRTANATLYAQLSGPESNLATLANAIYNNHGPMGRRALYEIRLPDGPPFIGGGTSGFRGNYFGRAGLEVKTSTAFGIQSSFFTDQELTGCVHAGDPMTAVGTIPDTLLFSGHVYDFFDKGQDIRTLDYATPHLVPTEDIALGFPTRVGNLSRKTRNGLDQSDANKAYLTKLQTEFTGKHPLGYPLFLETVVPSGDVNRDEFARNQTVVIAQNLSTGEFLRATMEESSLLSDIYRARIEFTPDSLSRIRTRKGTTFSDFALGKTAMMDTLALRERVYTIRPTDAAFEQSIHDSTFYSGERYAALPARQGDTIRVVSQTELFTHGADSAIAHGITFTVGQIDPPVFTGDKISLAASGNKKILTEDSSYTIFRITARDQNLFHDPRTLWGNALPMEYTWSAAPGSRASHWITTDTSFALFASSQGYLRLKGKPGNPDVGPVPELVTVHVKNIPPSKRAAGLARSVGQDPSKAQYTFAPQFSCATSVNADTLRVDGVDTSYTFSVEVLNRAPTFESIPVRYANLILNDSLRYDYDVQTGDEREDSVALAEHWSFPYGPPTSYQYLAKPSWLDGTATSLFSQRGIIHERMNADVALAQLSKRNGEYVLDTVVAIEVDDGHDSTALQHYKLSVNLSPQFSASDALPAAREDEEYNPGRTFDRAIVASDKNSGQQLRYYLIYKGDTTTVLLDSLYHLGPVIWVGQTPKWLSVDAVSGVLSGRPSGSDAPMVTPVTAVVVDEGGLTAVKNFTLRVDAVNHPPHAIAGSFERCADEGLPFEAILRFADRDLKRTLASERLRFEVVAPSTGFVSPSYRTGPLESDTVAVLFNSAGNFGNEVIVRAIDEAGDTAILSFNVVWGKHPTTLATLTLTSNSGIVQHLTFGTAPGATSGIDSLYCERELSPAPPPDAFDARWNVPGTLGTSRDLRSDAVLHDSARELVWTGMLEQHGVSFSWRPSDLPPDSLLGNIYLEDGGRNKFWVNMRTPSEHWLVDSLNNYHFNAQTPELTVVQDSSLHTFRIVAGKNVHRVSVNDPISRSEIISLRNVPNPFSLSTEFLYQLSSSSDVRIIITDMLGRSVETFSQQNVSPGTYHVLWRAPEDLPNGTYIARLLTGSGTTMCKTILAR